MSNMNKANRTGVLNIDYARGREAKKSLRYRLWRRTYEVLAAIEQFVSVPMHNIIDIGTADGRMLHAIHRKYPEARCIGIEFNAELVDFAKKSFPELEFIQGDISSVNFEDQMFDVAIAAAVIEHVPDPEKMMREVKRILKPGGILVLTTPDPFWEHVATLVGHLGEDQHYKVLNLQQLQQLAHETGFTVVAAKKFMLSPIGMPFELTIERIMQKFRLNFMLANQIIVIRCLSF